MDVTVIIVNYNSAQLVVECIKSIQEKTKMIDYEIVVVDNASQDNSVELIRATFNEQITIIESKDNLGFGKANNLGAKYANGDYLFLLNPDTILINNAIYVLHHFLKKNDRVGVAGGNLYSPELIPTSSYCEKFDDITTERRKSSWNYILLGKIKQKLDSKICIAFKPFKNEFNYSKKIKKVAYVYGADMMLKKSLFEKTKGFDPDFFMYAEEEELSWRITKLGYSIVSVPQAKIIHIEGATVKGKEEFSTKHFKMRMNGALTYYKKRFGKDGVEKFFKYRNRRYTRLIKIAKLQRKKIEDFGPCIQQECLIEVYKEFNHDKQE